jgi:hypothetical protein
MNLKVGAGAMVGNASADRLARAARAQAIESEPNDPFDQIE